MAVQHLSLPYQRWLSPSALWTLPWASPLIFIGLAPQSWLFLPHQASTSAWPCSNAADPKNPREAERNRFPSTVFVGPKPSRVSSHCTTCLTHRVEASREDNSCGRPPRIVSSRARAHSSLTSRTSARYYWLPNNNPIARTDK